MLKCANTALAGCARRGKCLAASVWIAAAGGTAPVAMGTSQLFTLDGSPVVMHYSLTFSEVNASTFQPVAFSNGMIDPGEAAYIKLTVSTTPLPAFALNDPTDPGAGVHPTVAVRWDPQVNGGSGSGWLWCIGGGVFDLVGNNGASNAQGAWSLSGGSGPTLRGPLPEWNPGGDPPSVVLGGARVSELQFGQININLLATMTTDPIVNVWRGAWTPSSFAGQTVTWSVANNAHTNPGSSVYSMDSSMSTIPIGAFVDTDFGSVSIPVGEVPGPSGSLLLAMGACAAARRRRQYFSTERTSP